jgi:hypothetical protein
MTDLSFCWVIFLFQRLYLRSIWWQNDVISAFRIYINIKTIGPQKTYCGIVLTKVQNALEGP